MLSWERIPEHDHFGPISFHRMIPVHIKASRTLTYNYTDKTMLIHDQVRHLKLTRKDVLASLKNGKREPGNPGSGSLERGFSWDIPKGSMFPCFRLQISSQ